jgi:hypothetical protein
MVTDVREVEMVTDVREAEKSGNLSYNFTIVCGDERICFHYDSNDKAYNDHRELRIAILEYDASEYDASWIKFEELSK